MEWGESEDLSLTNEEINFFKYINGKFNNSNSYNSFTSYDGITPRFGLTESQSEALISSEAEINGDIPNELIFLNSVWSETKFLPLQLSFFYRG
ncbi:MAG: hypothetical protein AB8G05_17185 [Oligoflexales bacterium]